MEARRSVIGPIVLMLVIFVALVGPRCTDAARVLSEDFVSYSSPVLSERVRQSMSWWLQRLESGPSPQGPGH
ncbi:uncharacterized protein J3R85_008229 [Psidium guajava]|nr:uncharacterized protein J3R85_008229 [Psidium guajava]